MLWTIAVVLFVLWALGIVTAYTISGFIHVLLVLAIIIVLIRVIQGRRPHLSPDFPPFMTFSGQLTTYG